MEYNQELLNQVINELKVEKITAKCLLGLGLNSVEECKDFLNPSLDKLTKLEDYDGLFDVRDRIQQAIDNKERVVIYGDYDADGVCSTAMLKKFLEDRGVDVQYFIPDRKENGYGMSEETIEQIAEEFDPDLYITVDCGITNVNEVDFIIEGIGADIVVTDHHEPQDVLPNCKFFNPHINSHKDAFEHLCGAGVVLRLIEALSSFEESLKYYDIATIATVADMVSLTKDNRAIVSYGLMSINSNPRKGLELLIKSFAKEHLTATDIGYKLAPRLNAVGRISNANSLVNLFIEQDYFLLNNLIEEITECHTERQALTKKITDEAIEQMQSYDFDKYPLIVVAKKGWDEGILGIVAAKLCRDYHRPAILLTEGKDGILKGSGRSIESVNIFECVKASSGSLAGFGGHSQACGLSLDKENLEQFKIDLNKYFKENYSNEVLLQSDETYFDSSEVKDYLKVAKELEMLEPFGQGNQKPLFAATIGNIGFKPINPSSPHIQYKKGKFQMVGFYLIDKLDILNSQVEKKVIFNLSVNRYNNFETAQAILMDIKCVSFDNSLITNYVTTALYPDTSIFHPAKIDLNGALNLIKGNDYTTAYICYAKDTFEDFIKACDKEIVKNSYFIESPCPNNAIYFDIDESADLSQYKNVVFLDRPISLGYIDILKLNKDCNVFYVENGNGIKLVKDNLLEYQTLGKIYLEIQKLLANSPKISIYEMYVDIEKSLNINYNNFIVAICIFMDLGILTKEEKTLKLQKNVKNPIKNSRLYNLIIEG